MKVAVSSLVFLLGMGCDVTTNMKLQEDGIYTCTAESKPPIRFYSRDKRNRIWRGISGVVVEVFDLNSSDMRKMHTDVDYPYHCEIESGDTTW